MSVKNTKAAPVSFKYCCTVVCFVVAALSSTAQTAKEIISKHIAAIGGQQKLDALSSYTFVVGPNTVLYQKPGKWRTDHRKDGKITQTSIYHGEKGWTTYGDGSTEVSIGAMSFAYYLPGYLAFVSTPEYKVESLGADPDSDDLRIQVSSLVRYSPYRNCTFYINPATYMITRMRENLDGSSYMVYFENYSTINGIKMPLTITKQSEDADLRFSETRSEVKLNVPLDNQLFQKPVLKKEWYSFKSPGEKYGFRDEHFIVKIKPIYNKAGGFGEAGLANVTVGDLVGYIDTTGKLVIPAIYTDVQGFYEGLSAVSLADKWGYVNTAGKVVVPVKYDQVTIFKDGIATVKLNKKWGAINKEGAEVVPLHFDYVGFFNDGKASATKDGQKFTIDKTGTRID